MYMDVSAIQSTENTEQSTKLERGTSYHQDSGAVRVLGIYQLDQEKQGPNKYQCSSNSGKEGNEPVHARLHIDHRNRERGMAASR
jgi:hypothetical protein